jgi:tetraacyldisaccharide 4'-kinase
MRRAPEFWRHDGWLARALSPVSVIAAAVTARRIARPGWRAPIPVICCGNVTVGGAGKTTLALDIVERLIARGRAAHVLLRGYGGAIHGPHSVSPDDPVSRVGDEALLLARLAPTWVGADRAASARAAVAAGAGALVLDDGLQNPTLRKDLSLLVVDGATGFGNERVLPAGPLREPINAAAARCQAAVLIGADATGAMARLTLGSPQPNLPVLRARLVQGPEIESLIGQDAIAFAGIAWPEKFFAPLAAAGVHLVARAPFPDHHMFTRRELDDLLQRAARLHARLTTTPKDWVRLPPDVRQHVTVVDVRLVWEDPAEIERLLEGAMLGPGVL